MSILSYKDAIKAIRRQQRRNDLNRMRENTGALLLGTVILYVVAYKLRKK